MSTTITNRTQIKRTLVVTRDQVPTLVRQTAVDNIARAADIVRAEIETLCRAIAPAVDKTFVMMKNKAVWFDRNNAALYPKFEEFTLPTFITNGQPSRNYSVEFEGFTFVGMTRREALNSFVQWASNPYMDDDGRFHTFTANNNVILTSELNPSGGVWFTNSIGLFSVNKSDNIYTLVPICRLKYVDSPRVEFLEAVLLWFDNELVPEGLSEDDEREYLRLMNEYEDFLTYLEYDDEFKFVRELDGELGALIDEMPPTLDRTFVMMKNKRVWFDRNNAALYPKFDQFSLPRYRTSGQPSRGYSTNFEGFTFVGMTRREALNSFTMLSPDNPYRQDNGAFRNFPVRDNMVLTRDEPPGGGMFFVTQSSGVGNWNDNDEITLVPIHRLNGVDSARVNFVESVVLWLINGLIPEGMSDELEAKYSRLLSEPDSLRRVYNAIQFMKSSARSMLLYADELEADVLSGEFTDAIGEYDFNIAATLEKTLSGQSKLTASFEHVSQSLLECDHRRANIEPYSPKQLTDINLGHWELFEPTREGDLEIELPPNEMLVARPPQLDVRLNGVCSIDFGTKSTIVVCRDGESRMLRIGKGDYSKPPTMADFENPTVIELRDIEAFLTAYRARTGRPFTEWEQVTVSHQAADAIFREQSSLGSSVYNSVFSELKQWAKDERARPILKDLKGTAQAIEPYSELGSIDDGDFDPIELYAYYLGLYINNMHHRIYLDYILSYPVNYRKDVRERIRASFERGLRKSLPPALQSDEAMMKRFRVYLGASEPAAYAITALECFGLEPREVGDKVAYGVFDFGGGTTDFDFGIESVPSSGRANFVIEQFGFNGDSLLGGENILGLLAYEVYKDNIDEMRSKKIPFALPDGCKIFAGAETLVSETKDASSHMNNRILAEKLRPIWERTDELKDFTEDAQSIKLFSSEKDVGSGQYSVGVSIKIDVEKLNRVIEARIRQGVENFFRSMYTAFDGKDVAPVHIFLAGNSCKSPVVREIFDEYIDGAEEFIVHEPLGLGDGLEVIPDHPVEMDLDRERTGKTGVAFGLIRCRRGGRDVKIVNRNVDGGGEMIFPYYLGRPDRSGVRFSMVIDRSVPYGQWTRFTFADEADFEVYYTSEARALRGDLRLEDVSMVHCLIDESDVSDDEEVAIYVRKVAPDEIEYAVGAAADFDGAFEGKVYRQKL